MSYPPPDPYGQPNPYGQQPDPYGQQPYPGQQYPPQYHGHYRAHPMSAPPYPPQPGFYPPPHMVVVPTSGLAVASLVFGLIGFFGGFCLFGVPCVFAVLFGHLALKETKSGRRAGHGMAVAGLILGYILLIPAVVVIAMGGLGAVMTAVTPATAP